MRSRGHRDAWKSRRFMGNSLMMLTPPAEVNHLQAKYPPADVRVKFGRAAKVAYFLKTSSFNSDQTPTSSSLTALADFSAMVHKAKVLDSTIGFIIHRRKNQIYFAHFRPKFAATPSIPSWISRRLSLKAGMEWLRQGVQRVGNGCLRWRILWITYVKTCCRVRSQFLTGFD